MTTSHEAKCVTSETSVSKKQGKSLQPRTPEYSKKTTPKVVSDKCVTSKTSVSNTCKGGEPLQPSGQKFSRKISPKVVTSKTSVSNTCKGGKPLQPSGQKSSRKISPKVVTSKTSVSNTCKGGEHLQPSGQKSSRKTTPKVVTDKCVTSKTSVPKKCGESLLLSGQKSSKKTTPKAAVSICRNPAKSKRLTSEAHSKLLHSTCKTKCNTNKSDNSLLSSSTSTSLSHKPSITIDLDIDANDVSVSSDTQEPTGDILTLLHDVQDSQPLEFPEIDQEPNNEIQNDIESESESSLGGDLDMKNNYVIQIEEQGHNLERKPCTQCQHDVDLDADVNSGWVRLEQNTGPPVIHDFQGAHKTYLGINMQTATPGEYFDQFFENKMWTIISENTNSYVQEKLASGNQGDLIESLAKGLDTNENVRLSDWRNTTPNEIKVVVAHLIVFGLLKKVSIEQYQSTDVVLNTPFFGRYMSRNQFQNILWNLHVSDLKKKESTQGS